MILNFNIFGSGFTIIFILTSIFAVAIFIFVIMMIFSPKLRARMMGKQIKATKYMMEENKDALKNINETAGEIVIDSANEIINKKQNKLKNISTKVADINKDAISITTKAIKDGIKDEVYCKHCGLSIDKDSKFCKHCGKTQN